MILAHGSGIDDILWFVIPVALAVFALRIAEKRAKARLDGEAVSETEDDLRHPDETSAP